MNVFCNPLNFSYRYQFNAANNGTGNIIASREAADPSMILFKGRYYIFPSMTAGFLYSDDLAHWELFESKNLPIYDYAPDVRVSGDYIYFCASTYENGTFYRTTDPFSDEYEIIPGTFPFWDPNLLVDDDGRFYFYWGSSTTEPLYGVELDSKTMQPLGEKVALCQIDTDIKGYERNGENHIPSRTKEEVEAAIADLENRNMPASMKEAAINYIQERSYMEGVWVNKHNGIYYLQYATPSSGHNIYGDGVYVSRNPLGPYELAKNNPYSYKPAGFLPGAGHGSTMEDRDGDVWHISTMRITINHNFERRIGMWPAGFDADDELFCNQRYGDWPMDVEALKKNPWADPEWMLLSYGKPVTASSSASDCPAENAVDENIQSWWKADAEMWSNHEDTWLMLDLGKAYDVHAVQINFADDHLIPELPAEFNLTDSLMQKRWIDTKAQKTRWLLEGSEDGSEFFVLEDKREAESDLPHDLIVWEEGKKVRYLRLTITELPYHQTPAISGLRVFGLGDASLPQAVSEFDAEEVSSLDVHVEWRADDSTTGYVISWGHQPEKLYHSVMTYENQVSIGGLVKDQELYIRVDSFNESGITEGIWKRVR